MATTAQYLEQLQIDKQTLVDNLVAKGIEATNDETFTTLAPKVADIETGGGGEDYFDMEFSGSGSVIAYIKTIPIINTSTKTGLNSFFSFCVNLESIPLIDTSRCSNFNAFCSSCSSLKNVPLLDTSKATDMTNMFMNCSSLEEVPAFNTDKVSKMQQMFRACKLLKTIPAFNTSNVISMSGMFQECESIDNIPELDASKVTNIGSNAFYKNSSLVNFGGLKNLGMAYSPTNSSNYSDYTFQLNASNGLTHDSLMNVINNLYDIATAGVQTQKLVLGSINLSKISSDEVALATSKGWTVS